MGATDRGLPERLGHHAFIIPAESLGKRHPAAPGEEAVTVGKSMEDMDDPCIARRRLAEGSSLSRALLLSGMRMTHRSRDHSERRPRPISRDPSCIMSALPHLRPAPL